MSLKTILKKRLTIQIKLAPLPMYFIILPFSFYSAPQNKGTDKNYNTMILL